MGIADGDVRRREWQHSATAELGSFAVRDVDTYDRRRLIGRPCNGRDAVAIQASQIGEFHVWQVKQAARSAFEVDHRQPIKASFSEPRHRVAISQENVIGLS